MPSYVQAEMENTGELFLHCGSKEIAGPKANLQNGAGENYCLMFDYNWQISPNDAASLENVSSIISMTVPIYMPLVASVFNAVNQKDKVKQLIISEIDRSPTGGNNKILGKYTATNGQVIDASLDKASNIITLVFQFEKISFDDDITNTSGNVITTTGD